MSRSSRIPIVLCIDVEPDARILGAQRPTTWHGFPLTWDAIESFRQQLSSATGLTPHVNWFFRMDPQVQLAHGSAMWVVEQYSALVECIARTGDGVGLHVHSWRPHERQGWIADYSSADWIDECLDLSFAAFRDAFNAPCRSFRFGDRWMDQRTMSQLDSRGVEVDLTLEPGFDDASFYTASEVALGTLPDYRDVPTHPYRPSLNDFRMEDVARESGIWILPVSTAAARPPWPHRLYNRWVAKRPSTNLSTALVSLSRSTFRDVIDRVLDRPHPHLVLTLRTGAATVPRYAARVDANLTALRTHPEAARWAWTTPSEAIQLLQE